MPALHGGRYDLIVAGAGIVGAMCVLEAARAGLRVALVEPGAVGGGATAAGMGHLVALDDDPAELALARRSLALWEDYAALADAEFHRCGTLWFAETPEEFSQIPAKRARLAAVGVAAEVLDAQALYEAEPALAPGLCGGLRVGDEAAVYAPRVARWCVQHAVALGAALHLGRRVAALDEDGGARLDDGTRLVGPLLVACGCATPALLPELPLRPRKGQLVITDRYPGALRHQVLELGYAASAHGGDGASVACNVQPRPTGQLLIGSSREYAGDDAEVSAPLLARMLERAFRFLPGLRALKALRAWTGFRPTTPDGLPYIGAVPARRDVWVAAGHEGLGVTTAPATARLLLDLLLQRPPSLDPAPYAPARACA